MKIIFFRHGEKSMNPFEDPGLTSRGLSQSQDLSRLIQEKILPKPKVLFSSPKKRATQTFFAASEDLNIPLTIANVWTEQQSGEPFNFFVKRIDHAIQELFQDSNLKESTLYICTHMDVLVLLKDLLQFKSPIPEEYFSFPTGGYLQFSVHLDNENQALWSLQNRGQLIG